MKLLDFFFISINLLNFINSSFGGNTETKGANRATTSSNNNNNNSGIVVSQNTGENAGGSTQPGRTQEDTGLGNSLAVEQNQIANNSRNAPSMPNTQTTESSSMMPGKNLPTIWESKSGTDKQKGNLTINDGVDQTASSEKRSKSKGSTSTDGSTDEKKDSRKKKTSTSKKTRDKSNLLTDDSKASTSTHDKGRSKIPESSSNNSQRSSVQMPSPISTGTAPQTSMQSTSTLDQAVAEGLLISFRAQRMMWAVPLRYADGTSCSVRPSQRPITHYLLTMKNIRIPVGMGTFQVRTVSFTYYPDAGVGRFVLLQCDCEISHGGFGYLLPVTNFHFAMFTPAESVCVDGKIHLLNGVMGPNSFFIFSYNPLSNHYKVLAHIVAS